MLSRKVVTRRGRGFRGYFPSRKLGRMVAWESLLERDAIFLLEFSPGVSSYQEQPTKIEYWDGKKFASYYPDFSYTSHDGELTYLEIKPQAKLQRLSVSQKLEQIGRHFAVEAQPFRVLDEGTLRQEPLLTNLRQLSYVHTKLRTQDEAFPNDADPGPWTCAELFDQYGKERVWRWIGTQALGFDLRHALTPETELSRIEEDRDGTVFF